MRAGFSMFNSETHYVVQSQKRVTAYFKSKL